MKPEKFTARVFICVIIAFMLLSVYGIGARTKKLIDTSKAGANIEWEKLYPFYEESEKTKSERFSPLMNLKRVCAWKKLEQRTRKLKSSALFPHRL